MRSPQTRTRQTRPRKSLRINPKFRITALRYLPRRMRRRRKRSRKPLMRQTRVSKLVRILPCGLLASSPVSSACWDSLAAAFSGPSSRTSLISRACLTRSHQSQLPHQPRHRNRPPHRHQLSSNQNLLKISQPARPRLSRFATRPPHPHLLPPPASATRTAVPCGTSLAARSAAMSPALAPTSTAMVTAWAANASLANI